LCLRLPRRGTTSLRAPDAGIPTRAKLAILSDSRTFPSVFFKHFMKKEANLFGSSDFSPYFCRRKPHGIGA
jgi:hypothetical protein